MKTSMLDVLWALLAAVVIGFGFGIFNNKIGGWILPGLGLAWSVVNIPPIQGPLMSQGRTLVAGQCQPLSIGYRLCMQHQTDRLVHQIGTGIYFAVIAGAAYGFGAIYAEETRKRSGTA